MPTAFYVGPYRFFFYAGDGLEPPHVHVRRDDRVAKIWLDPVRLDSSGGFRPIEINRIVEIARKREQDLLRSWYDYFTD